MVHVFLQNELYIALDVNSGNIYLLDEITGKMLEGFPDAPPTLEEVRNKLQGSYAEEAIAGAYEEVESLIAQKMLYSPAFLDEKIMAAPDRHQGIKALCLHVTHDCNLRCGYCFANQGDYRTARRLMSTGVAFKAIDFLIEHSARDKIEIDFFGGEPLLNYEVVKNAVAYGKEQAARRNKRLHFTLTTNGLLLDEEKISFLNREMHNIVISLDGRKEVHDRFRYDVHKEGTYQKILPKAVKLVEERKKNPPERRDYFIRGTFTAKNLDFSRDVLHLAGLGFERISLEPVVGSGADFHLTQEHLPAIMDEYEKLAQIIKDLPPGEPGFNFYHFNLNLYKSPCVYKRISACGAGFEYFAVSPEGDLYPCHQFVGTPRFKMGNVRDGIENPQLSEDFRRTNILTKEICKKCWAKFFCSGGCHANAYYSNGDPAIPNELACAMQRKRIECAIGLEVTRRLRQEISA